MRIVNAACFCLLVALSVVAFQPDVRQTRFGFTQTRQTDLRKQNQNDDAGAINEEVRALDYSSQFLNREGDKEIEFLLAVRKAVAQPAGPPQ